MKPQPQITITPKTLFTHRLNYLSRSFIGMRQVLIIDFKLEPIRADKLIKSWIDKGEIVETETPDNHYLLKREDDKTSYRQARKD